MALHFQRTESAIMSQLSAMNLYPKQRQTFPKEPKCKCSQCDLRKDCEKCSEKENWPLCKNSAKGECTPLAPLQFGYL